MASYTLDAIQERVSDAVRDSAPFITVSLPKQPALWGPILGQDRAAHPYMSSRVESSWMEVKGKEARGREASSRLGAGVS